MLLSSAKCSDCVNANDYHSPITSPKHVTLLQCINTLPYGRQACVNSLTSLHSSVNLLTLTRHYLLGNVIVALVQQTSACKEHAKPVDNLCITLWITDSIKSTSTFDPCQGSAQGASRVLGLPMRSEGQRPIRP